MSGQTRLVLISSTPDPQKICSAAARLSSVPGLPTQILDETPESGYPDYLRRILSMGHHSIMEHANFTIAFENVSVFVEQFMISFRLNSFTVKSRRYVSHANAGYIVPYMTSDGASDLFSSEDKPYIGPEFYGPLSQRYLHYCEGLFLAYKRLLDIGIPTEDARFVLPYSFKSNFISTGNARSWIHMINAALNGRGRIYPEIHWIGTKLNEMLIRYAPALFSRIADIEQTTWDKEVRLASIVSRCGLEKSYHQQKVVLISHTPDPDSTVAKTSLIGASRASELDGDKILNENVKREVIRTVIENTNARELEQATFTFRLSGMSLPTLTHLSRHRMQSIIIPSFVQAGRSESIVIPPSIEKCSEAQEVFNSALSSQKSFFDAMDKFNVPPENRVYAYISAQTIDTITTMNARELLHFITLRTCNRAQWEIREYALAILSEVKKVAPITFSKAGPSCFSQNECKEGRMSCGKMLEMREYFGK